MAVAFTEVGKKKIYEYFGIPPNAQTDEAEKIINADPAKKMQYARFKSFANQMAKGKGVLSAYVGVGATGVSKNRRRDEYTALISAEDVAAAQAAGVSLPSGTTFDSSGNARTPAAKNRGTASTTIKNFKIDLANATAAKAEADAQAAQAQADADAAAQAQADAEAGAGDQGQQAGADTTPQTIEGTTMQRMTDPTLPTGAEQQATQIETTPEQFVAQGTGEVTGPAPTATATTATPAASVAQPTQPDTSKIEEIERVKQGTEDALSQLSTEQVDATDPRLQIDAQQQTTSAVSDLEAAQGTADLIQRDGVDLTDAPTRTVGEDELIKQGYQGLSSVDQQKVGETFGTGEVQAASVQDELSSLMAQFEGGDTPAWAAGSMRRANQIMAQRGLSASSMAGQAVIQAAMEAALPIAQIDAGNKQQMALFKAEQRAKFLQIDFDQDFQAKVMNAAKVEQAANMQFSADQQIVLENSRLVNSMNLANLNNRQSLVLAEASALANLDMANLSNRQQAEVMNAQTFLQIDMANMENRQQVELFKTQQRIGALFSDQSAANAAQQFNASSENQTNQFFENLKAQVQQFNTSQLNAMEQFNAGQANTIEQFNSSMLNQRDQFNAQNQLVVSQNNAAWRRQIATIDTAAINRANELNANAILNISNQAYQNLWQYFSDESERAWKTSESEQDRMTQIAMTQLQADAQIAAADKERQAANSSAVGGFIAKLFGF